MRTMLRFLAHCDWVFTAWIFVASLSSDTSAQASMPAGPAQTSPRPDMTILRFDENWSALQDRKLREDFMDRLKYIPLGTASHDRYVTMGGEFREAYEQVQNDNWSAQPYSDNRFTMERFQLHIDTHLSANTRVFLQFASGQEQGRTGGPRRIDKKELGFLNAFFEATNPSQHGISVRFGKQEMSLGAARLVSTREGTNIHRSFYGASVFEKAGSWNLEYFAMRPTREDAGFFRDEPDPSTSFYGIYAQTGPAISPRRTLDLYYFGIDRKKATFNRGTAREQRQSIGIRIASAPTKAQESHTVDFRYDVEAVFQLGSFGPDAIRAWTISTDHSVTFPRLSLRPSLGLKTDVSSGDQDRTSHCLRSFNALFPAGSYFGILADTGPGPINFYDLHPLFEIQTQHGVTVRADWIAWSRESLHDGVYDFTNAPLVLSGQSNARFVGHRPGLELNWQIDRHFYIQSDYGVFFAGPFLRESGFRRNLNYSSVWTGYRF